MGKQKTHNEYANELSIKNPNVVVVDEYINAKTPIKHKCLIHDYVWCLMPTNALKGQGCPLCRSTKISNKFTKSHKQYVHECQEKHPNIEVLGIYINANTAILHRCKIDDYMWSARPTNILSGAGCPKCANNIKYTQQEYIELLNKKNPNISLIGEYINMNTPILHYCKKHDIKWDISPYHALEGCGCTQCGKEKITNKKRSTHEKYISDLYSIRNDIEVLEYYIDSKTPILHRCKIHNVIWSICPSNALGGKGCPKCKTNKISNSLKKDNLWYTEKLKTERPHIVALEEYVDYDTKIKHYCTIHQYEWMDSPRCVFRDIGCPKCTGYKNEIMISDWLDKNNILYIRQYRFDDCKDKRTLPFDFYLPNLNVCIEYDGRQHYESIDFAGKGSDWSKEQLKITQYHDEIKNKYCKNNNIKLLRISYLQNIEEELQNFIRLI